MNLTGQTTRQRRPREQDRKYLDSFRDMTACEACGNPNDGTIVGAHAPFNRFSQAKHDDALTAGLCSVCHDIWDGRTGDAEGKAIVTRQVLLTVLRKRHRAWRGAGL